jgi:SnoaL-like domain
MAHNLDREAARAIEWDCTQLLTRFFNAFDQWRYDDMAAMFAPDGVWHRAGKSLKGATIMDALNARSRTQTVRHVVTNIEVSVRDASTADFILYVTAYMHDSGAKATKPPKITSPYLLLVVPGTLVRAGDDWKIASMSMNREFEF